MGYIEYVPNYVFEVWFGKSVKVSFSKVSNLSNSIETRIMIDGANNSRPYFSAKPNHKPETITFEKGTEVVPQHTALYDLTPGVHVYNIMILVRKGEKVEKVFGIDEGIVTSVKYSDLDGMSGQILVRTIEIQHTGLLEIPK